MGVGCVCVGVGGDGMSARPRADAMMGRAGRLATCNDGTRVGSRFQRGRAGGGHAGSIDPGSTDFVTHMTGLNGYAVKTMMGMTGLMGFPRKYLQPFLV